MKYLISIFFLALLITCKQKPDEIVSERTVDAIAQQSIVEYPVVTARISNAILKNGKYIFDVQFKSLGNVLYAANVRMWYDCSMFKKECRFVSFADGYATMLPTLLNGSTTVVSLPRTAINWFHFNGDACWINGAIQLSGVNKTILNDWTTIFKIELTPLNAVVCPPIVFDLEYQTLNGGFINGNSGLVMIVVKDGKAITANEKVEQFNWTYDIGKIPYGHPINCEL